MNYQRLLIFVCFFVLANGASLKSGNEKKETLVNPVHNNDEKKPEERQLSTALEAIASGTGAAAGVLLTPLLGPLGPVIGAAGGALGGVASPLVNSLVNQLGGLFSSSVVGSPVPIASYNAYLLNVPDYGQQVVLLNAATPLGFRNIRRQLYGTEKHIAFNTNYEINTPLSSQLGNYYLQDGNRGPNEIEPIPNINHLNTEIHVEDNSDHVYATNPVKEDHNIPQIDKPVSVEEHSINGQGPAHYNELVTHIEHLAQSGIPLDSIEQVLEILKKQKLTQQENTIKKDGKGDAVK